MGTRVIDNDKWEPAIGTETRQRIIVTMFKIIKAIIVRAVTIMIIGVFFLIAELKQSHDTGAVTIY